MSERKVLNKYFPPDFDPSKLSKDDFRSSNPHVVRLMAPFSMRCLTCSEWIPKGKKFNARKERAKGEHYLGILIHRFYIRCPMCSSDITFKTDPEKTDYVCESGAQRNFEILRDERLIEAELQKEKEQEEARNPISKLEARTLNSKREMEIQENLDELRKKSAAYERGGSLQAIEKILLQKQSLEKSIKEDQEKQDEELARSVFYNADGEIVKRVPEMDPIQVLRNNKTDLNDKKRKNGVQNELGIVRKKEKDHVSQDKKSSLNILGAVYGDTDSD